MSIRRRTPVLGTLALPALALAGALWLGGCSSSTPFSPVPLPPLSAVAITTSTDTIQVGQVVQFTATAYDTLGAVVGQASFLWTTSDPAIASVTSSGRVTGVGEGTAMLRAEAGGFRDSVFVTVFPDTGWIQQTSNAFEDLEGVFFLADGRRGWAVGSGGVTLRTTDAGVTWTRTVSSTFDLHGVWFTSSAEGWAVGSVGTVLRTTNGGATWTRLTNVNASENLLGVHFATRDTGWAVGTNGAILRTFDRGQSWTKVNPTPSVLHAVAFSGTRDGWAVGTNGVILGTHDRGLTWFIVQPSVTGLDLRSVSRRSESQAWAVGELGAAPRTVTTPDSTAWELRNAGAANDLEGVSFASSLVGYAAGWNGVGIVLRTDDGGVSWSAQAPNAQFRLNAVYFVDELRGWAVGDNGTIRHTARGGLQ